MMRHIIVTLIALVLIVGGYIGYMAWQTDSTPPNPYTIETLPKEAGTYSEEQAQALEDARTDADIYNSAIADKDPKGCESIVDVATRDKCTDSITHTVAIDAKDKTLCTPIKDEALRNECVDSVVFALASIGTPGSICSDISDATMQAECATLRDKKLFTERIASGSVDAAFCETLGGEMRETCVARIAQTDDQETYRRAIASKDISACNRIKVSTLQSQCRDTLIFELALLEKNSDYCENISDTEKSAYCKKSLSTQNEALLYQQIISGGDISRCSELVTESYQRQCHDVLTIALVRSSQDTMRCQSLYNTGMIANCMKIVPKK